MSKVPFPEDHRDTFDRLIIATAIAESAAIISADQKFNNYSDLVKIIW
ncbi:PIN domain-containing protein [Dyadobacter subterraneus]